METFDTQINLTKDINIPLSGLGTSRLENCEEVVYQSIKLGIRLIDTAKAYDNEIDVGKAISRAIKDGFVKREELFVLTKIPPSDFANPEEAIRTQLEKLQLDYIDLYLIHCVQTTFDPNTSTFEKIPLHKTWEKLEKLHDLKLVKALGVSNFSVQILMDLLTYCRIKPVANEIEFHPYLVQEELVKFCQENSIQVIAYNSLCLGTYARRDKEINEYNLLQEKVVSDLAKKYGVSNGQICLNWAICKNIIVIPKSSKPEKNKENLDSTKFRMSKEDIDILNSLNKNKRFMIGKDKTGGFNTFA